MTTTAVGKRIGRPTKLTPELQERICKYIADGNYITTSCQACGISFQVYRDWLARAETGEKLYVDFADATKKAEAECQAKLAKYVTDAAPKSWQAAMTMLERRWPEQYARMDRASYGNVEQLAKGIELLGRLAELATPKPAIIEGEVKQIETDQ